MTLRAGRWRIAVVVALACASAAGSGCIGRGPNAEAARLFNEGVARHGEGEVAEAADLFRRSSEAARATPLESPSRYNLGLSLYERGDLSNALNAFGAALLLNPADDDARYNYAYVKARLESSRERQDSTRESLSQARARELLNANGAPVPLRRRPLPGRQTDRDW
jgi:tetratricopeptide (TPR) repeat protein